LSLFTLFTYLSVFTNVFNNFLGRQVSITIEAYGGVIELSDLIKNIFICVVKMNESLTGLEQHEGESLLTEFSFLGKISL